MRVFVGDSILLGDGLAGGLEVGGVVEELVGEGCAGFGQFVYEYAGEEAGGFGYAEFDVGAGEAVQPGQQFVVLARGEVRVEVIAVGLQHGN